MNSLRKPSYTSEEGLSTSEDMNTQEEAEQKLTTYTEYVLLKPEELKEVTSMMPYAVRKSMKSYKRGLLTKISPEELLEKTTEFHSQK